MELFLQLEFELRYMSNSEAHAILLLLINEEIEKGVLPLNHRPVMGPLLLFLKL